MFQFIADSKEDLLAWKEVLQAALKSDTARDDLVAEGNSQILLLCLCHF